MTETIPPYGSPTRPRSCSFSLDSIIATTIDLRGAHTRAQKAQLQDPRIEATRGRGSRSQTWAVLCSRDVAMMLQRDLEALRGRGGAPAAAIDVAIATIAREITP